jgi:hypothetical protein
MKENGFRGATGTYSLQQLQFSAPREKNATEAAANDSRAPTLQ